MLLAQPSLPESSPSLKMESASPEPLMDGVGEGHDDSLCYSQRQGWTIWRQPDPSRGRFCWAGDEAVSLPLSKKVPCWHLGERMCQLGV